jgi:hypothetical protein
MCRNPRGGKRAALVPSAGISPSSTDILFCRYIQPTRCVRAAACGMMLCLTEEMRYEFEV